MSARELVLHTWMAVACMGVVMAGEPYEMHRQTIDGGGTIQAAGQDYRLSGTIGQSDAGVATGGAYQLFGAFWFPVMPGDSGEDGDVDLPDITYFLNCATGPGNHLLPDECRSLDVDSSGAIDLADLAEIQMFFSEATGKQ